MEKNNWQIVKESLTGDRVVDEQSFASLAVLEERLEHLRQRDEVFATVEFSDDVKKLQAQSSKVPVY